MTPPTIQDSFNLALQHHQAGDLAQAENLYRQILAQQPKHAETLHLLGLIAHQRGHNEIAVELIGQALTLKPESPVAQNNLGTVLKDLGRYDQAIAVLRQAIALNPNFHEAHNNLGIALKENGQFDEAIAAYQQCIALNPNYPDAHNNLGNALMLQKGDWTDAELAYGQAIALKPDYAEAHHNLAQLLLLKGDYAQGWREYEWRWKCKGFSLNRRAFEQPYWDGSDLNGRTILVYDDQGFGDVIQCVRFVPHLAQRAGKVIVCCQLQLRRLLTNTTGAAQCLAWGDALPKFDVHCALLSLPLLLGITQQSVTRSLPYLQPDENDVKRWRIELAGDRHPLKVGLVWAGRSFPRNRSMPFAALAPLSQVRDASFYSLQKGEAALDARNPPHGFNLIDRTADLHDFADTAALIANLDLVISIDTGVAHLAGAMGKPAWTLLKHLPDWPWLLERTDSPWYPTMRLFRQTSHGDWDSVVGQVAQALAALRRRIA